MLNSPLMKRFCAVLFLGCFMLPAVASSQIWQEPQVEESDDVRTPYQMGARIGWGFDITIDNFGFGIGTQYKYMLSNQSEFTITAQLSSLRDLSEQSFQSFYTEVIPNKYQRVISYPLLFGYKQRVLSDYIYDNFRIFVSGAAGPSFAFAYPYFDDVDGNGLRTPSPELGPYEEYYDVFMGWSEGSQKFGYAGELMLNFDFGDNNKSYTSIRLGYMFHYFSDGIQVMEPFRYKTNERGQILVDENGPVLEKAADKQNFFGSPAFHITFGGLW